MGALVEAGGVEALVQLVSEGIAKQREFAAGALKHLGLGSSYVQSAVLKADGLKPLADRVRDGTSGEKLEATEALRNFARASDGAFLGAVEQAGAVHPLMLISRGGGGKVKEFADECLKLLATGDPYIRQVILVASADVDAGLGDPQSARRRYGPKYGAPAPGPGFQPVGEGQAPPGFQF